jgi:hypothetical protein
MMNDRWLQYLKSIGMTATAVERVQTLCARFVKAFDIPIKDMVVSDYFDKDGNRQYASLWIVSDNTISELKQFMTSDNVDFVSSRSNIMWLMVSADNYDFDVATASSTVTVNFRMDIQFGGQLMGVSNNCPYILDFSKNYLVSQVGQVRGAIPNFQAP